MEIRFKLPGKIPETIKKIQSANHEIYIVGGAVRDILMGKEPTDWDFATSARPEEIQKIFPKAFYNNQFGTVGVPDGDNVYEITTFRSEGQYLDLRHPTKVTWGKTIEEDLKRRDFTINAMALKTFHGSWFTAFGSLGTEPSGRTSESSQARRVHSLVLIDPFGGQNDLDKKIVRAVGKVEERFKEDALRMMRAVRIATELGFTIEEKTLSAISANANLITKISNERVRDEIFKILSTNFPADGFLLLKNTGVSKEILPELDRCFDVEQASPGRHHIYDVGTHLIESLRHCPSKDALVRFGTLIHDIGKPQVIGKDKKGSITFYNHEVVGAKIARNIADRFHLSKKQRDKLITLVRWHQFTVDEATTPAAIRRFIARVGVENIQDMIDLRIGDRLGGGLKEATGWRLRRFMKMIEEELHPPFKVADLAISGHDVMRELKLKPGPKVGQILNTLFEEVQENKKNNTKKFLLKRLREIKK